MSATKQVLEVTHDKKTRVHRIAKKAGSTVKETTDAILGWALSKIESGIVELHVPTPEIKDGKGDHR